MEEFKLEINLTEKKNFHQLHVCIKCIDGVCGEVINKLKEEYEGEKNIEDYLCLIMIKLKIKKGEDRQILMSDFYNNVTKYGRGLSHLSNKLKGGAHAVLCMLLKKAVTAGLILRDDVVYLEASGDLEDESGEPLPMENLIKYYNSLGFKVLDESTLEEQLDNMSVPMGGVVSHLLGKCMGKTISPELRRILGEI